jgi:ACT domain-containing protein
MSQNPLSEFEISKITEIVAGRMGVSVDAKTLRQVIDRVVDSLPNERGNPSISGGTCETPARGVSAFEKSGSHQPPPSVVTPRPAYNPRAEFSPTSGIRADKSGGLYDKIEKTDHTRIIVAAFGTNRPGIVAALTNVLAECQCSIEDISQTIMQEFFSMIMVVNIGGSKIDFTALRDKLISTEATYGMKVYVMHEDIFRYMHRI